MEAMPRELLYGRDDTPGILSVSAGRDGRARVWRRDSDTTLCEDARFPNWFLTTSLDLLAHLSARHLPASALRSAHGDVSFSRAARNVLRHSAASEHSTAARRIARHPRSHCPAHTAAAAKNSASKSTRAKPAHW